MLFGVRSNCMKLFEVNNVLSKTILLVQLVVVLLGVSYFEVEYNSGIGHVAIFIAFGWLCFLFVQPKLRKHLFLLLGTIVVFYAFGFVGGLLLLFMTIGLIGVCHLPIPFPIRWLVIIGVGALFYVLRSELFYMPRVQMLVPFISSMFMFRIIIYMHDLKYGNINATWVDRLSYFLMFPNLCFLLFPIIDFKLFVNNRTDQFNELLYQKGLKSLYRGCVHILIYRLVYHYVLISPVEVSGALDSFLYLIFSYTLILRLSGIFHLCLGFLQIFGYDLPKVFDNYFLASSPSDLWRRVNLYWREFMMKIFYYRIYLRLKSLGSARALILTSLCVFVLTWFFHSYQWFWFQGSFLFSNNNTIFWLILGLAVSINAYLQFRKPRKKKQSNETDSARQKAMRAVGTVCMFLAMSVLWSLWSSPNMDDWAYLMGLLVEGSTTDYLTMGSIILMGFILLFGRQYLIGAATQYWFNDDNHKTNRLWTLLGVLTLTSLILFKHLSTDTDNGPKWLSEKLNSWDTLQEEEGYYEGILGKNAPVLWELQISRKDLHSDIMEIDRSLLMKRLKPNISSNYKGGIFTTNSLGMRDKDYSLKKDPKKFRILLVGGSYELGAGVNDGENFESVIEASIPNQLEIFNLAVGGYNLPQISYVNAHCNKYNGDALLTVFHTNEGERSVANLARLIKDGRKLSFDYLKKIKLESGARQHMSGVELRQRLSPYASDIEKGYLLFTSQVCDRYGLQKIWVFLPSTKADYDDNYVDSIIRFAESLGFKCIDLRHVYDGLSYDQRVISDSDSHPNADVHQRIALELKNNLSTILKWN